jgi:hypothetical protein
MSEGRPRVSPGNDIGLKWPSTNDLYNQGQGEPSKVWKKKIKEIVSRGSATSEKKTRRSAEMTGRS